MSDQMGAVHSTRADLIWGLYPRMVWMGKGFLSRGLGFAHAMGDEPARWAHHIEHLVCRKCLCDHEGGTCKNAASLWEKHSDGGKLLSSWLSNT